MYKQETSNNQVFPTSSIESIDIRGNIGNKGTDIVNPVEKNSLGSGKKLKEMCNVVMCERVEKNLQSKSQKDPLDENGKIVMCDIVEKNSNEGATLKEQSQPNLKLSLFKENLAESATNSFAISNYLSSYVDINSFSLSTEINNQEIEELTDQKGKNCYLQNFTTKFSENNRVLYCNGKFVMNCIVRISNIIVERSPEGQTTEWFEVKVFFGNGEVIQKKKLIKEFREPTWLKELSDVMFNYDEDSRSETSVLKKYLNYVNAVRRCEKKEIYDHQGWTECEKLQKLVYITKSGVIGFPNIKMESKKGKNFNLRPSGREKRFIVKEFIQMSNIVGNGVGEIILLYVIQSYMYTFFKKAGIIPKMTMFLAGTKGSHKTLVALCMAEPNNCITPKYTFKGTTAGLETGFPECTDAVQVIDDLMPVQDLGERRRIESNLEMITRCYGDGTQRIRNNDYVNANGNHKNISQYKANGGCLFTGEYYSGCGSTLARTILLNMDKKMVNLDLLTYYQNHSEIKGDFLIYFIEYLTKRQEDIINAMKYRLQQLRDNQRGRYSNPRYGEYYSTLRVAAEILLRFGVDVGAYTELEGKHLLNEYDHIILKILAENDRKLKDEEPHIRICKAIWEAYIDPVIDKVNSCDFIPNGAIAIDQGNAGYVYIRMKDIIYYIKKYRESYNEFVESTESQVIRSLKEYGILIPKKEGSGIRNTMKISGNRSEIRGQRFAYLNLNKVKEYIGE